MSREWKPGDVAMSDQGVVLRCLFREKRDGARGGWTYDDGSGMAGNSPHNLRPLVVIDPEDRKAVERLRDLSDAEVIRQNDDPDPRDVTPGARGNALQAALREFANPTPPSPPEDVTARVTDRRDNIWRLLADGEWVCVDGPDHGEYLTWERLSADRGPLGVTDE